MATPEIQSSPPLGELLTRGEMAKFNILPLSPLGCNVLFVNGDQPALSLREALKLSPQDLLKKPLMILTHQEQVVASSRKPGGRLRSRREVAEIREQYERERQRLLGEGPGRILAAIANNSGKEVRWSRVGLVGGEDWLTPTEEECSWWDWVYEQKGKGVEVEKWWQDGDTGIILHAVLVMRFRLSKQLLTQPVFDDFIKKMTPLIPESRENGELIELLRKINTRFPS